MALPEYSMQRIVEKQLAAGLDKAMSLFVFKDGDVFVEIIDSDGDTNETLNLSDIARDIVKDIIDR